MAHTAIGKQIRKRREALVPRCSQKQLAERSGVTREYINRLENGLLTTTDAVMFALDRIERESIKHAKSKAA